MRSEIQSSTVRFVPTTHGHEALLLQLLQDCSHY